MGKEHVCITNKDLQQMKNDLKNPAKKAEIKQKMQEIQNCVYCKRKLMKFWAKQK